MIHLCLFIAIVYQYSLAYTKTEEGHRYKYYNILISCTMFAFVVPDDHSESITLVLDISGKREDLMNYGATAMISQGQNQARKRVLLFLTAFVITGFFSKLLLCCMYLWLLLKL